MKHSRWEWPRSLMWTEDVAVGPEDSMLSEYLLSRPRTTSERNISRTSSIKKDIIKVIYSCVHSIFTEICLLLRHWWYWMSLAYRFKTRFSINQLCWDENVYTGELFLMSRDCSIPLRTSNIFAPRAAPCATVIHWEICRSCRWFTGIVS